MDKTVEGLIQEFVKNNSLIPQYHPERMKPTHFMIRNNTICTYDTIVKTIEDMRENGSSCQAWGFNVCKCKKFKLDNLKYLESCYEHTTSKTIY